MAEQDDDLRRITEVISKAHVATLTTIDDSSALHSRPLALKSEDFGGTVRFLVMEGSEVVDSVRADPRVNVAVQHNNDHLSLAGTASVSEDPTAIDELWSPFAEAWFPEGREDPRIRVLTVDVDTAEYWVMDSNPITSVVSTIKAAVGRGTPDMGTNRGVQL